ncbi:Cyanovirin-N [Polyplosphaeria fusca]|uniref:Cyanovirin-N n=1 Tax=Polyplosphaeria fusca TaxID=682080 RepID=A0A9P4QQ00_9PLEO|nr:Cyanovirin-N [Polyplosphaeria fusca]
MSFRHALIALASCAVVPLVLAGPLSTRAIGNDCTRIRLQGAWLVADCLTGQDSTTRIESTVWLASKIGNDNAILKWGVDGNYQRSCTDCQLTDGAKLTCSCRPNIGQPQSTTLDLDQHIRSYSGHLLSDLSGPRTAPRTTSSIKIPADVTWALAPGGESTFTENPTNSPPPAQDPDLSCRYNRITSDGLPAFCDNFRVPVSTPVWEQYRSMRAEAPGGAWAFEYYGGLDCAGEALKVVGPGGYGVCDVLSMNVVAVTVRPLWNADV